MQYVEKTSDCSIKPSTPSPPFAVNAHSFAINTPFLIMLPKTFANYMAL